MTFTKGYHFWIILLSVITGCAPEYLKFDRQTPGLTPQPFAEKVISLNREHVGYCAFSADGSELYYAITNKDWFPSKLLRVSSRNLNMKDTLKFVDEYEGEPFLSRDGKCLYFMAFQPPKDGGIWQADQYVAHREQKGGRWINPSPLDTIVNSKASEWHVSFTEKNDVIYFTSERIKGTSALHGDIYRAEMQNGQIVNRDRLPNPINTDFNDSDPLIAPDESYLIFHSNRPGGFGEHDLYITFKNGDKWTDPVNMGASINTDGWEMGPSFTPDGKYLLFTYRKAMITTDPAKIMWVSTKIIDQFRR